GNVHGGSPSGLRNEGFAVTHERRLDDAGIELFVADLHRHGIARRDADGHPGERDRLREGWRESAAGDLAAAYGSEHLLVTAQDPAPALQQQADLLQSYRRGRECRFADAIAQG